MTKAIEHYLKDAIQVSKEGGKVLKEFWRKSFKIGHKETPDNLVTEADHASEKAILAAIEALYPSHAILSEEAGQKTETKSEFLWIVDPLDGTINFTHGYPFISVSVGLVHQGEIIAGVVYNPIYEELFTAGKGLGAYFNGEKMKVSKTPSLDKSLLATGFAYDRRSTCDNNYKQFCQMTNLTHGVRRAGSAALDLAYVAFGRLDGYWERGLNPWDVTAGALLVTEAGGKVTAYDKSPFDLWSKQILATNGHLHELMSKELSKT